jgi:hypothetical protein
MNTGDWIAIGAIANAAMAIATFILAIKTRSMSEATKNMVGETKAVSEATLKEAKAVEQQTGHIAEQVKISSNALRASVQPWLTWVSSSKVPLVVQVGSRSQESFSPRSGLNIEQDGDDIAGYLVVRNVGTGIALLNLAESCLFNANNPDTPFQGIRPSTEIPIIPPGEEATVKFKIPGIKGSDGKRIRLVEVVGGGGSETMYIELVYSDVLGAVAAKAKFQAYRKSLENGRQGSWKIIQTTYCQEGREPIVVRSV